jgi:hydroxyacylglutathione hydrolase
MRPFTTKNGYTVQRLIGLRSNSYLVKGAKPDIIVDTSVGAAWKILDRQLRRSITRSKVFLVLTHAHFDHVRNGEKIVSAYGATVIADEKELANLGDGANSRLDGSTRFTKRLFRIARGDRLLERKRMPRIAADIAIAEDRWRLPSEEGLYILRTPGHTEGSISVIVDDQVAIVGDALFGVFRDRVLPPWAYDTEAMVRSWKALLDTGCARFYPGHGRCRTREQLEAGYLRERADRR